MLPNKICFASDNWSPAHHSVMQSLLDANQGNAPSYGADSWTEKAQHVIQENFKKCCKVFFIPSGTASNVFALKLACRRYESIICSDIAHINTQESGAAESITGCKLITVPHCNGKISPENILKRIKSQRAFGKHTTSPRVLSITQPTEVGTVYTLDEMQALSKLCEEQNLLLHIDGSRFYNAVACLGIGLDQMVGAIKVDLLSLGGTKNGLMGAECLLIFNPDLHEGSDHMHKQSLQLMSKMRYISAQYIPYFENNLWHSLAMHANQKAKEIAAVIEEFPELKLSYPVETNQIFFIAPESWIPLIQEKIFCYPWDMEKKEMRFIASWNTTAEDLERLKEVLMAISKQVNAL